MTNPNQKLYLGITAAEMLQSLTTENAVDYWATNTPKTTSPVESNHAESETAGTFSVSNVKLTGGDKDVKYHCTAKYKITVTRLDNLPEEAELKDGDGLLKLSTVTTSGVTAYISDTKENSGTVTSIDHTLKDLEALKTAGKEFYVVYDFTRSEQSAGDTADLKAAFKITNTKDEQNYLAGKEIVVTIVADETDNLKCEIVEGE